MARILLVDDNHDISDSIRDLLELKNHTVVVAFNGSAAQHHINSSTFDLILLDWQLPDMAGVDICQAYRQAGGTSPILMMTGMRDPESQVTMKRAGATNCLLKPFNIQQLLDCIEPLLPSN